MTPTYSIKQYIHDHVNAQFNVEEDSLPFPTETKSYSKGARLTKYGDIEEFAYLITEGIAAIHSFSDEGPDVILGFFLPGQFVSAYTSYITRQESDVEVVAITPLNVEVIRRQDIRAANAAGDPIALQLSLHATEGAYAFQSYQIKDHKRLKPYQRFKKLLETQPILFQRLSLAMIAKFIGVTRETLSRWWNDDKKS